MSPIRVSQVPKLKSDFHRARSAQTHNKRSRTVGKKLGGSLVTTEASREETWTFLQDRYMAWLVCYQLAGLHLSSFLFIFFLQEFYYNFKYHYNWWVPKNTFDFHK